MMAKKKEYPPLYQPVLKGEVFDCLAFKSLEDAKRLFGDETKVFIEYIPKQSCPTGSECARFKALQAEVARLAGELDWLIDQFKRERCRAGMPGAGGHGNGLWVLLATGGRG